MDEWMDFSTVIIMQPFHLDSRDFSPGCKIISCDLECYDTVEPIAIFSFFFGQASCSGSFREVYPPIPGKTSALKKKLSQEWICDHITYLWRSLWRPSATPFHWPSGGPSICRPLSGRLSGCWSTRPGSWSTPPMWAGGRSECSLCGGAFAMTTTYTGAYWPRRWDWGILPLWAPPPGWRWSLLGRLRGKQRGYGEMCWKARGHGGGRGAKYKPQLIFDEWAISVSWLVSSVPVRCLTLAELIGPRSLFFSFSLSLSRKVCRQCWMAIVGKNS